MTDFFVKIDKNLTNIHSFEGLQNLETKSINSDFFVANCNSKTESFLKSIPSSFESSIKKNEYIFDYGIVISISKKDNSVKIFTDVYGITTNYYFENSEYFFISNSLQKLKTELKNASINVEAVSDYLLFNYPIQGRTYISEIYKMTAAQQIIINENKSLFSSYFNWDDIENWKFDNQQKPAEMLAEITHEKYELNQNNLLALSGGFDSKTILGALSSKNIPYSAYSFGSKKHVDVIASQKTSKILNIDWIHFDTSNKTKEDLQLAYKKFIHENENLAFPPTLMNYVFINDIFDSSQIYTGKMGGELIVGPSLISGLVITNYAQSLLNSNKEEQIYEEIHKNSVIKELFNSKNELNQYIQKISVYLKDKKRINSLKFLMTETYAHFFGQIQRVLTKHVLTNPFTDLRFIKSLYDAKLLYISRNDTLSSRLFARLNYYKWIKKLDKKVLKTPLDRGLNLASLNPIYLFAPVSFNYIKRKLFRNKSLKSENKLLNFLFEDANEFLEELKPSNTIVKKIKNSLHNEITLEDNSNQNKLNFIKLKILVLHLDRYK